MKSEVIHRRGTELTGLRTGLLVNFNVVSLKQGIKRVINTPRNSVNSVPLR